MTFHENQLILKTFDHLNSIEYVWRHKLNNKHAVVYYYRFFDYSHKEISAAVFKDESLHTTCRNYISHVHKLFERVTPNKSLITHVLLEMIGSYPEKYYQDWPPEKVEWYSKLQKYKQLMDKYVDGEKYYKSWLMYLSGLSSHIDFPLPMEIPPPLKLTYHDAAR